MVILKDLDCIGSYFYLQLRSFCYISARQEEKINPHV